MPANQQIKSPSLRAKVDNDEELPERADEAADGPEDGNQEKRYTKADLYKAYKGKGPYRMNADFLSDIRLRAFAAAIVFITDPLQQFYHRGLKAYSGSPQGMIDWIARRAAGETMSTANAILQVLTDPSLYAAMRLTPACNPPVDISSPCLADDIELASKAVDFSVCLASNYAWGQLLYQFTLPLACATLLMATENGRKEGMGKLKELVESVMKAEEHVKGKAKSALASCLRDLGWTEEPLAREFMVRLLRANFELDNQEEYQARRLALRCFLGSCSTKEILESVFADLQDAASRTCKNKKIASHAVWFYASTSKYVNASGMSQLLPDTGAWVRWRKQFSKERSELQKKFNNAFKISSTELPTGEDIHIPGSAAGVKKSQWRNSGPLSHYRASAAALYLMADCHNEFKHCSMAWAGLHRLVFIGNLQPLC